MSFDPLCLTGLDEFWSAMLAPHLVIYMRARCARLSKRHYAMFHKMPWPDWVDNVRTEQTAGGWLLLVELGCLVGFPRESPGRYVHDPSNHRPSFTPSVGGLCWTSKEPGMPAREGFPAMLPMTMTIILGIDCGYVWYTVSYHRSVHMCKYVMPRLATRRAIEQFLPTIDDHVPGRLINAIEELQHLMTPPRE
jgi:hypothetical protein